MKFMPEHAEYSIFRDGSLKVISIERANYLLQEWLSKAPTIKKVNDPIDNYEAHAGWFEEGDGPTTGYTAIAKLVCIEDIDEY